MIRFYVTWLIHTWHHSFICDRTHSYAWYDWIIYDMTHSYVTPLVHTWHDWFMFEMNCSYMTPKEGLSLCTQQKKIKVTDFLYNAHREETPSKCQNYQVLFRFSRVKCHFRDLTSNIFQIGKPFACLLFYLLRATTYALNRPDQSMGRRSIKSGATTSNFFDR